MSIPIRELANSALHFSLPFAAVSRIAVEEVALTPWLVLLAWTALAYALGRWQFERSLVFDRDEAGAAAGRRRRASWMDGLFRWPSLFFSDPLAALVEKELRFLSRAPRFRLVFVMGFSFGLLVWLPIAFAGGRGGGSVFASNYLTFVSVYALLLLAEATFWNAFGFDRAAAQRERRACHAAHVEVFQRG
ncbi:MAG: hypothetical protein GY953_43315, partial [bacterium]|nr:hypothetical protein [bacterium]